MSLEAFGVKNLRCLSDTGLVPIRPITVLVGRNSSGKSTFLRAFPLLRQSVETARNSPILWYLEPPHVDFGSLKDASNDRLSEPSVTFQFRLRLPKESWIAIDDPAFDIAMTLEGSEIPYISAYEIRIEGHKILWAFNERGRAQSLIVNDKKMELKEALSLGGKAYLMPTLHPGENLSVSYQATPPDFVVEPDKYQTTADKVLLAPLADLLTPHFHGNTAHETIRGVANDILLGKRSAMHSQLISGPLSNRFKQSFRALDAGGDEFEDIVSAVAARLSPYLIEAADLVLAHTMSRVAYLGPLRVSPERAYRIQNLAVAEVDPDGKNLAMFLQSLTPAESASFATFTRDSLGFETMVEPTRMHAEIRIKEGRARRFINLVDVGFGYSEVLPLAAVLWASCIRPAIAMRAPAPLLAIEQPELHLHSAHQAKLARMIVEAMQKNRTENADVKIIVETHSESLINGLGKLVYDGVLKADDVQIVLFDQDEETAQTTVRLAGYRESGALHDWPYGFLSPVAERRVSSAAE